MGYILGLDLGPTSIGWAAIETAEKGKFKGFLAIKDGEQALPAIGARIFPAGVENLNQGQREEPKNKKRREKRSTRRRLRRARARRSRLVALLQSNGFLKDGAIDELQQRDPYSLRADALSQQVELEDLARIFLHFAKRRGFKSNRKQPEEKDAKASDMKMARDRLEAELDGKTIGQFWHGKLPQPKQKGPFQSIRNRRNNYQWIAQRHHYQEELARIWQTQAKFYPDLLTHSFYQKLEGLLFDQIRFELSNTKKRKTIGTCSLVPGKIRCGYSERIAQKFRMLQKVNDILIQEGKEERSLNDEERKTLIEYLSISKEKTFAEIRKKLWGKNADQIKINLEYRANEKAKGNATDALLVSASFFDKKEWLRLSEAQKDDVWAILQNYLKDDSISSEHVEKQVEKYGVCFKKHDWPAKLTEPKGNCNYSIQALEKIVPFMEQGDNLYTAIEKADFKQRHSQKDFLPLPDKSNGFQIPNPVVQTVMFQLRKVVNLLIKENGLPDEIVIETARELKANKERRKEILANQSENLKEKQAAQEFIRNEMGWSHDVEVSNTDVIKYRLWQEQDHYCPYACTKIKFSELLSRETEIDHILPYSMSLDNTMNNKVVCFSKYNQEKGQNTPISWLGADSARWQAIQDAMNRNAFSFSDEKWERFSVSNHEIAEKYQPERLLRDTSYITREVRSYLKQLYPADKGEQKVRTTKGPVTSELRNLWKLNAILRDGEQGPKNRDDLRHHAVDAAVIAVTSQQKIQQITKTLQKNWPKRPKCAAVEEPWDGFGVQLAQAVDTINVSHRVQRKAKGALHKETNYGVEANGQDEQLYVTRKELRSITPSMAEDICDPAIREMVLRRLREFDNDAKKAFEKPLMPANKNGLPIPVHKVRIGKNAGTMIPLNGTIWVEPGENHHVELFRIKEKGKIGYICKVWTVWDVIQRIKNKEPIILKQHPAYPDAEFVLSLSKQESIRILDKKGSMQNARVLSISGQPNDFSKIDLEVRPLTIGATRNLSETEEKSLRNDWRIRALKDFETRQIQKITVDPLGRVRRAGD